MPDSQYEISLSRGYEMTLLDFYNLVYGSYKVTMSKECEKRLEDTREFVDYLLEKEIRVYGLTTGFADLRDYSVSSLQADTLSENILESHDAGIGESIPEEIVLGAMFIVANSLSKGNSAVTVSTLNTLLQMINARIVPVVPSTGSLGASGDLAFLARVGRAMQGKDVLVHYLGKTVSAKHALEKEGISPFKPSAKEGLALTNGTCFMSSMLAIAYLKEVHLWENIIALQGMFLNSVRAIDAAFVSCINDLRRQEGQTLFASILQKQIKDSPFIDRQGVQNDYCIRCLPQIFGPKFASMLSFQEVVKNELNAVTDNPLIFRNEEISEDVPDCRILSFKGDKWAVLSGGNFHGECLATVADALATQNAKLALTMERQLTYLNNPSRNKNTLPIYLIADQDKVGLQSGFMVTQYTANALAQKISHEGMPASVFNMTSGNESEDVVSYGATACEKLLRQLKLLQELTTVYFTSVLQAYSLARGKLIEEGVSISLSLPSEEIFRQVQLLFDQQKAFFPLQQDRSFASIYEKLNAYLKTRQIQKITGAQVFKKLQLDIEAFCSEGFLQKTITFCKNESKEHDLTKSYF